MATIRRRKLPSGAIRWLACYRDTGGDRRFKAFKRKGDAEQYLARTVVDMADGRHVAPSQSITFADAAELWLRRAETDGLRPSTREQYSNHVRHLVSRIGQVTLTDLTRPLVSQLIAELKQDLSLTMVRKIKTSLTSSLGYAQEMGRIGQNVALGVKVTRRRTDKKKLQPSEDFPSREEVSAIISNVEGKWRAFIIAAIFTGMRASELRGLQWSDIDLEQKTISVRRMADHLKSLRSPKSQAGTRTIPIGDFLANTLAAWRDECPRSHLDMVFPGEAGAIATYSVIYRSGLRRVLIKCGFVSSNKPETLAKFHKDGWEALSSGEKRAIKPRYGLHAFRHFYASWRLEQRYNVKQVQTWLGHENATMTLDLYGHLLSNEVDQDRITREEIDLAGRPQQHAVNTPITIPLKNKPDQIA